MPVPVKNIVLYKGADYSATGELTDDDGANVNIENDTFVAEIKENILDAAPVIAAFTFSIFQDGDDWKYTRSMTDTAINALTIKHGVWDQFRIEQDGTRSKMLEGTITVKNKVTES